MSLRPWRAALTVLAVAAAAVLVVASPAAADTFGGYATANVNIRNGPSVSATKVGSLANGTHVHVYCVLPGDVVNGNQWWDKIGTNQYVTDAYVFTGFDAPIAQKCGGASGWANVTTVPGCGPIVGDNGNSNAPILRSPEQDWFYQDSFACSGPNSRYYFTYGAGPTPTTDFVRWEYYVGAYGHCSLAVSLPSTDGHTFDTSTHYQVLTGFNRDVVLMDIYFSQQAHAGDDNYGIGTWTADGSGFIGLKVLDSSQSGSAIRVVAGLVRFTNCVATM